MLTFDMLSYFIEVRSLCAGTSDRKHNIVFRGSDDISRYLTSGISWSLCGTRSLDDGVEFAVTRHGSHADTPVAQSHE